MDTAKYIIYGNIVLYILFIIITIYFINYVYNLDSVNKYATYMQNECDGQVIEQYTMRYITYNYIDTQNVKTQQTVIRALSILLLLGFLILHGLILFFRTIIPIEIYEKLFTFNVIGYIVLAANISYITTELKNVFNIYNQITDYKKIMTDTKIILSDSIFKNKILNDLQLNDYTPIHSYLKILLKRKSLYENLNSINDAIIEYNESIDKNNYDNLIKYIDFKTDRNDLVVAYIYSCSSNILIPDQYPRETDLNNAEYNTRSYLLMLIQKMADDPYFNIQSRDMNYKLEIFNDLLSNNQKREYIVDRIGETFKDQMGRLHLTNLNYINIENFYKLADYNYGNILYNSEIDTYYTGNNEYVLVNSKYEIHVLNMKFYLVFLLAFIGFIILRLSILNNLTTLRLFILVFLIIFIILLFIISILRAF